MHKGFWNEIKGNWKQFKGEVRKQWGKLTDDDLDYIKGEREKLVGRIQERYGEAQSDVERMVDEWVENREHA